MATAQHQADRRLSHAPHQLCQRQSRLYISARSIEDQQNAFDCIVLLCICQQRDDMLIFCRLCLRPKQIMPFNLPDNTDDLNILLWLCAAKLFNLFLFLLLILFAALILIIFFLHSSPPSLIFPFFQKFILSEF